MGSCSWRFVKQGRRKKELFDYSRVKITTAEIYNGSPAIWLLGGGFRETVPQPLQGEVVMSSIMIFSRTIKIMLNSYYQTEIFQSMREYCPIAEYWKWVLFSQMAWYTPDAVSDMSCLGISWLSSLEYYKILTKAKLFLD